MEPEDELGRVQVSIRNVQEQCEGALRRALEHEVPACARPERRVDGPEFQRALQGGA